MVRSPTDQQRVMIIGRTGSGKSQFACGLMSTRNFDEIPWIIIDYKGEDLIDDIQKACEGGLPNISVNDNPPSKPGLYRMQVMPVIDDEAIDKFLWKCHAKGNIGLFVDEGYTLPQKNGSAFDVVLTQGRSKHIPVIVLYQRPVWMSRFAVAQADFFAVFDQNDERDLKVTSQFIKPMETKGNEKITVFNKLPKYHCLWYDVSQGITCLLSPAPDRQTIIDAFTKRLKPRAKRVLI